jgi:hypothetical protein
MHELLCNYYRCPEKYAGFRLTGSLPETNGFFKFGDNLLYGRAYGGDVSVSPNDVHWDARGQVDTCVDVRLPFDAAQVAEDLRFERYSASLNHTHPADSMLGRAYYFVRPLLPVKIRRQFQKRRLGGWNELKFPHWPVDLTVDNLVADLLLLSLRASGAKRIPFIWFWPAGAPAAAVLTHDVETTLGRDYSGRLMDIDDSFDIKASFQVVPEKRYEVTHAYINSIWKRGFEVAVQDLNHDGRLYLDRKLFLERVKKINQYGKEYGASGFRSAILYRNQEWYSDLEFSYDMSVPNVAHLDPQRGGCCTVMPYFVGKLLELPVTTTQDYSLFHILNDYSIDLWKQQIALILGKNGLINVIIHPDYVTTARERRVFEQLLSYMKELRTKSGLWIALPKEVDHWWRQRAEMRIIEHADGFQIEGEGKERARIAYASEENGKLVFEVETVANYLWTRQ